MALATTVHAYKGIKSGDGLQPNCPPITPTPTATTHTQLAHNIIRTTCAPQTQERRHVIWNLAQYETFRGRVQSTCVYVYELSQQKGHTHTT